jgi:uncharacterized RDD family membrane protein YckC
VVKHARMGDRTAAVLVDHMLLTFAVFLYFLFWSFSDLTRIAKAIVPVLLFSIGVGFLLSLVYFTLFEGTAGQTPGKKMQSIRVVDEVSLKPVGMQRALIRNLLRLVDVLPVFYIVGFILTAVDDRKRRLGDRLVHTIVIKESDNM